MAADDLRSSTGDVKPRTALVMIPERDAYPLASVQRGLTALGIAVVPDHAADLLVTWSPWLGSPRRAAQANFEASSRPVIVLENGWLSPLSGMPFYQIARNGWNGRGAFLAGTGERWASWRMTLAPWRRDGPHTALVVGQWGHLFDKRSHLPGWHREVDLPPNWLAIRRDKGESGPIEAALAEVSRVVVWTSGVASWAVLAGVPVHYCGPNLMVAALAAPGLDLDQPVTPEREPELERLAWAQWNAAEIATGEPFARALALP